MKERHLETSLHAILREIILVQHHPRTLIQIIIQILALPPESEIPSHQSASNITILPYLLQVAQLALLQSSLPLSGTLSTNLVAVLSSSSSSSPSSSTTDPSSEKKTTSKIIANPTPKEIAKAGSLHAVAYKMPNQEMLLLESEGMFTMQEWKEAVTVAEGLCEGDQESLKEILKREIQEKGRWREG